MNALVGRLLVEVEKRRRLVVVVGDVMVDRWVHGHSDDCQDNCRKFIQTDVVETPGGAANAERSISKWDVRTVLHGYNPDDCPVKTRFVEDGKILFRHDDDGDPARGKKYQWSRDLALQNIRHASAVLLSDYDKGFLTPEFMREVADLCGRRGVPCVADCKRGPDGYVGCILKANSDYQHRHNQRLGELVFDAQSGQRLVVTAAGHNPVVWDGAGPLGLGCDLPPVPCVNHVGAGDCFAAHLALALAYGLSLKEAAAVAHSAGRIYVQHPHNRPPTPAEVAADMSTARLYPPRRCS